jgi:hypothetical protein
MTRQQRFVRRPDSQAIPSSKQKGKSHEHRTRPRTAKPPAHVRRDFKQLRVHRSGNCRFLICQPGDFPSVGSATRTRQRLIRSPIFCPSPLRHFIEQGLIHSPIFRRCAKRAAGVTDAGKLAR